MRTALFILIFAVVLGLGLYYRKPLAEKITGRTVEAPLALEARPVVGSVTPAPVKASPSPTPQASPAAVVTSQPVPTSTPAVAGASTTSIATIAADELPTAGPADTLLIAAGLGLVGTGLWQWRKAR